MKLWKTAAASVAAMVIAASAHAASWDFGADAEAFQNKNQTVVGSADGSGFEGTFDQVYNDTDSSLYGGNVSGGIRVEASATTIDPVTQETITADPFMDAISNNLVAGLGVCSSGFNVNVDSRGSGAFGGMSACSTQYPNGADPAKDSSDDNLLTPEILKLTFTDDDTGALLNVSLDYLLIRKANHELADGEIFIKTAEGDAFQSFLVVDGVVQGLAALGKNSMYFFTSSSTEPEIYLSVLSVQVPVPAAGFLLLGGLGGLAAMKRRKKA